MCDEMNSRMWLILGLEAATTRMAKNVSMTLWPWPRKWGQNGEIAKFQLATSVAIQDAAVSVWCLENGLATMQLEVVWVEKVTLTVWPWHLEKCYQKLAHLSQSVYDTLAFELMVAVPKGRYMPPVSVRQWPDTFHNLWLVENSTHSDRCGFKREGNCCSETDSLVTIVMAIDRSKAFL